MYADRLAIGSPFYNFYYNGNEYIENGRFYIYKYNGSYNNWNFEGQYDPPTQQAYQNFGFSIALTTEKLIVGASGFTEEYYKQGKAYLYEWGSPSSLSNGFRYVGKIAENHPNQDNLTGASVAISNQFFIIGSPGYKVGTGKVLFGSTSQ